MGQHMACVCHVEFFGNGVDEVWCADVVRAGKRGCDDFGQLCVKTKVRRELTFFTTLC